MPHFQNGATDYQTYLQRAVQMGGEVMDLGLPQLREEEIKYAGDGQTGHWVELNRCDHEGGRFEGTILEVHTATNCKFALWRFTENHLKHWTCIDGNPLTTKLCLAVCAMH